VTLTHDDEPAAYLRSLAVGLAKCGIPVQHRADADRRPYVRASHPEIPLSTDVYCVRDDGGILRLPLRMGHPDRLGR
jgi:hypothetical protein